ncbi:Protein phosphatase 2C 6 [Naganishia albida]|nr:Protein phosphatase 2C 6 [Naganishia albida]
MNVTPNVFRLQCVAVRRREWYTRPAWRRAYHDYIRGQTADGHTYKVNLKNQKVIGVVSSRGTREYQEDRTAICTLGLSPAELELTYQRHGIDWSPKTLIERGQGGADLAGQVGYFGIFDGHGGPHVAQYLHERLHAMIEEVCKSSIDDVVLFYKKLGGYFKRFRGGALQPWVQHPDYRDKLTLEERITLTFLQADQLVLSREDTRRCGSTASVALIHSLDEPVQPFYAAQRVSLMTAHLGDTKILLCNKHTGKVEPLTERHHAESRVEAARLRRLGGQLITDSFGESRWMGAIENTRSFGDGEFKPLGVTAEPEIKHRLVEGSDYAYMVFVTDGISTLISNQEIIDLARTAHSPQRAAQTIVNFAEDLGAEDNCTCMVVPLAGWGEVGGRDETEARREYRKSKVNNMSSRMKRM